MDCVSCPPIFCFKAWSYLSSCLYFCLTALLFPCFLRISSLSPSAYVSLFFSSFILTIFLLICLSFRLSHLFPLLNVSSSSSLSFHTSCLPLCIVSFYFYFSIHWFLHLIGFFICLLYRIHYHPFLFGVFYNNKYFSLNILFYSYFL